MSEALQRHDGTHDGVASVAAATSPSASGSPAAAAASPVPPELARLRHSIDNIDSALVHLMAERFRATQQVGVLKADLELPASDPAREAEQVARLRALAEESGLDPVFAEKFFAFIVAEVIRHHEAIAAQG